MAGVLAADNICLWDRRQKQNQALKSFAFSRAVWTPFFLVPGSVTIETTNRRSIHRGNVAGGWSSQIELLLLNRRVHLSDELMSGAS
jgi:hypothetical protein